MSGAEALALLIPGATVEVTEHNTGKTFTGVLEEINPSGSVTMFSTYRVRRDTPVRVHGFLRLEYWATAEELQPRSGHESPTEAKDFEVRR